MAKPSPNDLLSPHISPSKMSKKFGVRRVNNGPIYVVGTLFTMAVLIVVFVALNRAKIAPVEAVPTVNNTGDVLQLAHTITGDATAGFVPAADTLALPNGATVPIALTDDLDKPPMPPRLTLPKENAPIDPDDVRINQEKMQLFENAVRSKTSVAFTPARATSQSGAESSAVLPPGSDAASNDTNTTFKARLAQLQDKAGNAAASPPNDFARFDSDGKTDRWQLDTKLQSPKTPYTLRAGFVIPASLISGINSELPGQIIAQVSQNVYDTPTGKYLLIPQGSRLVGTYSADVAYGQSRVMVAWQRIIFPDGKALDIGAMPGADSAGYSGFNDQANNHYLRIFGSAILMSGITAGATLSQNNNGNSQYGQETASTALSAALGQQLGTVTSQMISKNLTISPTLEIRPGFLFNVMCVKDLVLEKPYSSFDL